MRAMRRIQKLFTLEQRTGAARAFLVSGDVTPAAERLVAEVAASAQASGNLVSIESLHSSEVDAFSPTCFDKKSPAITPRPAIWPHLFLTRTVDLPSVTNRLIARP